MSTDEQLAFGFWAVLPSGNSSFTFLFTSSAYTYEQEVATTTARSCGGSHTVTYPHRRSARMRYDSLDSSLLNPVHCIAQSVISFPLSGKKPQGPVSGKSRNFSGARHFAGHKFLWIFKTKASRIMKLASYFNLPPLCNIRKDQPYRISGSEFHEWLFGTPQGRQSLN